MKYLTLTLRACFSSYTSCYEKDSANWFVERYLSDEGAYIICRKLMSLIYLPLAAVQAEYDQLCCQLPEDDKELLNLFEYYKSTWLLHGI